MACCPTEEEYGYEDSRFEKDVDENFHCSICYNVLKEPRMCRNNEHVFCLACISEHLKVNSQTCPECNERLSVDTLRRPRVLNNYLSKLKINCDYASRGCPEFTCVQDLKTHVASCGFAPVFCSNENCGMEINKQERDYHETVVCEYRKVKCHDCGQIQEDVGTLKGSLIELDGKVEATNNEIKNNHAEMKTIVGKLEGSLVGMNKRINEKVDAVKEMNRMVNEKVETLTNRENEAQQEVKKEVREVRREVKDVKENLSKVNKDVDEVRIMMIQMLEKLNMLELLHKLPSPIEEILNTPREDILIAGGETSCNRSFKSVTIYSWEKNGWFEVSPMNEEHAGASSFIYNDQLFVVGGDDSKTIETLELIELPLKWMEFAGELPYGCSYHQTVVSYQQYVIHIGGFNYGEWKRSNMISVLQLTPYFTIIELCEMPEPREYHAAEIIEDRILVLGGQTFLDYDSSLDRVFEFDIKKNECKEMPPLPQPLTQIATVRWRDQVVVLGGRDKDGHVLNDVFMYDCKTGKITALPSMLEKRCQCCAIISANIIVVMGGVDENYKPLSSVECFTMGGSTWEYLSAMNEARYRAVAEVLPSTRKYVQD